MADIVRRVDGDPRLATFWKARFPFADGWEGWMRRSQRPAGSASQAGYYL